MCKNITDLSVILKSSRRLTREESLYRQSHFAFVLALQFIK